MTIDYQKNLPAAMRKLPVDADGHPVPFFVAKVNGEYDFRIMDSVAIKRCILEELCWVCGNPMNSARGTFVIGSMCAVNRTSSEPPSHFDCAVYSATHCPFLITPRRKRRTKDLPEDHRSPGGVMIERNPQVALVWTSRKWWPYRVPNGVLFNIGEPLAVQWFHQGRAASRDEVVAAIESGLPILQEHAAQQEGGVEELARMTRRAMQLVPA